MLQVFGIRHHGPGSAQSLIEALKAYQPDCLLIEGPSDAQNLISYVNETDLIPPVAILVYNPKALQQAFYYPFAIFSPEWQAMKFGLGANIPTLFMDLPTALSLGVDEKVNAQPHLFQIDQKPEDRVIKDPLGYMGKLAGYEDGERWWEVTFEQASNPAEIFESIFDLMKTLREELKRQESPMTLVREAYMRKQIRKAIKDGYQRIAIVCGAWHAPALKEVLNFPLKTDNALLKGIKKTKVQANWIPWSYNRLAYQGGYAAGVLSPAWYELLFADRQSVTIRWMAKVAELLRQEDLETSSAHVLEAVRLAETLATIRKQAIPGINELQESAITIFCQGSIEQLELIREKLILGNRVGQVPSRVPTVPIQKDLDSWIKSTRLTKYQKDTEERWLKATKNAPQGGIDLRDEKDLEKSHLLHRLNILNIPWGENHQIDKGQLGGFKEFWKMQWDPEFALRIIEAGMWGNTVLEAATHFVLKRANEGEDLPIITKLVDEALKADLKQAFEPLISRMQHFAAVTKDVYALMEALPPLVEILRYGSTRKIDTEGIRLLIQQFIPRIVIGLPGISANISEDIAPDLFERIQIVHRAIHLIQDEVYQNQWYAALNKVATYPQAHPLLQGGCLRLLFDKNVFSIEATTTAMQYALSKAQQKKDVAHWLEGFLHGSGLLLLYNPILWNILDEWIDHLVQEDFLEILPLLRRTFSSFPEPERQKMLVLAKDGPIQAEELTLENNIGSMRTEKVFPILKQILDLE